MNMFNGLMRRFSSDTETLQPTPPAHAKLPGYPLSYSSSAETSGITSVFQPPRSRTMSPFRPPPLDPLILTGYHETTPASGRLLMNSVAEEIRNMLPERLRITETWRLLYSLEQDGASLTTLYQRCRDYEGRRTGFVLVVRDAMGGSFGAYLSEAPRPAPTYFGNGECFLWRASTLPSLPPPPSADTTNLGRATTLAPSTSQPNSPTFPHTTSNNTLRNHSRRASLTPNNDGGGGGESIRFKAFPYSGVNEYFINCETGFLSIGAGDGHYGLWVDNALERGNSATCLTFGNEPLSDEGIKFDVLGVELWVVGAP